MVVPGNRWDQIAHRYCTKQPDGGPTSHPPPTQPPWQCVPTAQCLTDVVGCVSNEDLTVDPAIPTW